jgi:hypothetical protein
MLATTYEVMVRIKSNKPIGYSTKHDLPIFKEIEKMFHKEARTGKQAMDKCRKYGTPISVRKVDVEAMHGDYEKLPIRNDIYFEGNPKNNALAMDEMIFEKRNKRRDNLYKDKINVTPLD